MSIKIALNLVLLVIVGSSITIQSKVYAVEGIKNIPSISTVDFHEEFQQDLNKLHSFRIENKKLDDLKEFVNMIQKKWYQKDKESYLKLMLESCRVLRTNNYNGGFIASTYAKNILEKTGPLPLDIEVGLVECLLLQDNGLSRSEKEWLRLRSELTKLWLHPLQRIEESTDKNFNFNKVPINNVSPPPGAGIALSGMSPSLISDPKLRSIYEADIAKNKRQSEEYLYQQQLRDLKPSFIISLEAYLVAAYSKTPSNLDELKQDSNLYIQDASLRNRILTEVTRAIQRGVHNEPYVQLIIS